MGTAGEPDALKRDLTTMLFSARADSSKATGDPAGSQCIGRQETIAKIDDYERPEARQALQGVSDGALGPADIAANPLAEENPRGRNVARTTGILRCHCPTATENSAGTSNELPIFSDD